jgi:hypothetical protein
MNEGSNRAAYDNLVATNVARIITIKSAAAIATMPSASIRTPQNQTCSRSFMTKLSIENNLESIEGDNLSARRSVRSSRGQFSLCSLVGNFTVWSDNGLRVCCVRFVSGVIHSSLATSAVRDACWSNEFEDMSASAAASKRKLKRI